MNDDMLVRQARAVLDFNWTGQYTMPGPRLYPHQWSWDSAFIAIGYSHYYQERATKELRHLFEAQWKNGLLPQLVFNPHFTNVTWAKPAPPPNALHTAFTHSKAVATRPRRSLPARAKSWPQNRNYGRTSSARSNSRNCLASRPGSRAPCKGRSLLPPPGTKR